MSNNESMNSPAFDGMLMNIVQRNKGIEGFFDAVYGFLRRKTDFFANKDAAAKTITSACERHLKKYMKDTKDQQFANAKKEAEKKVREQ